MTGDETEEIENEGGPCAMKDDLEAEAAQLAEAAPRVLRLLGMCPLCGGDLDEAGNMLTWEELDKFEDPQGIAELLEKLHIGGFRKSPLWCPLANATGWVVDGRTRRRDGITEPLTRAEMEFVEAFDNGSYPKLVREY